MAQARASDAARAQEPRGTSPFVADASTGDGDEPDDLDLLDVIEAMSAHFHEHQRELLHVWSWKYFCAMWVRLIAAAEREEDERAKREADQELAELKQAQQEQQHDLARMQSYGASARG